MEGSPEKNYLKSLEKILSSNTKVFSKDEFSLHSMIPDFEYCIHRNYSISKCYHNTLCAGIKAAHKKRQLCKENFVAKKDDAVLCKYCEKLSTPNGIELQVKVKEEIEEIDEIDESDLFDDECDYNENGKMIKESEEKKFEFFKENDEIDEIDEIDSLFSSLEDANYENSEDFSLEYKKGEKVLLVFKEEDGEHFRFFQDSYLPGVVIDTSTNGNIFVKVFSCDPIFDDPIFKVPSKRLVRYFDMKTDSLGTLQIGQKVMVKQEFKGTEIWAEAEIEEKARGQKYYIRYKNQTERNLVYKYRLGVISKEISMIPKRNENIKKRKR